MSNKEQEFAPETPNNEAVNNSGTSKRQLGVRKDTRSKAGIPINAPIELEKRTEIYPNGYEFPVARLTKVTYDPAKEIKRASGNEILPILSMMFTTDKNKQFTHVFFPIDDNETDEKFEASLQEMHQKIKHIFEETIGINNFKEEDMQGTTFEELFNNVALAFNSHTVTKNGKEGEPSKTIPLYYTNQIYIKLTYYKDNLQFPKYPNFVQRAFTPTGQIPCELIIVNKFDKIKAQTNPAAASPATAYTTGNNAQFGGGSTDFPDFPNV